MSCIHYAHICVFTIAPPSWWLDTSIRPLLWCEGIWAGLVINVHQDHVFQCKLGSQQRWEHYSTSQAKTNYTAIWCSETLTIKPDLPLAPQGESRGARPQQCDMTHVVHTHTLCVCVCVFVCVWDCDRWTRQWYCKNSSAAMCFPASLSFFLFPLTQSFSLAVLSSDSSVTQTERNKSVLCRGLWSASTQAPAGGLTPYWPEGQHTIRDESQRRLVY